MAIINHNSISGINTISVGSSIVIGDNFVLNANGIENVNGINITGVITASSFVGDGSTLTGIDATALKDTDGNVVVQAEASGINVTGVSTFGGNVSVAGTFGVTNVSYFSNDVRLARDGNGLNFSSNSSGSQITNTTTGDLILKNNLTGSNNIILNTKTDTLARFLGNAGVELYYDNSKKFETTVGGVDITGHAELDNVNIAGVLTATSAEFTGDVTVLGDLTYENVTNLDSVGVATARSGLRITGGGLDVVGVSTFSSDLIVPDKIIHAFDTDTAIRFPADNTFTVETAGIERVRIANNGRIGVGTISPLLPVHVEVPGSGASDAAAVLVKNDSTSYGRAEIQLRSHNNYGRVTLVGGAEGSAAGNGTFDLKVWDNSGASNTYIRVDGESYSNYLSFWTGSSVVATNTEKMRITKDGNIGIGSTVPTSKLDINPGGNSFFKFGQDADNPKLEIFRSTGTLPNSHYGIEIQQILEDLTISTAGPAALGSHSFTERLRITSTGNMGLGVTPESWGTNFRAFQIGSTGSLASQVGARTIELATNAYNNSGWKYTDSDVASLYYQYNGEHIFSNAPSGTDDASISFTERLRITSSGQVLVAGGGISADWGPFNVNIDGSNIMHLGYGANYDNYFTSGNSGTQIFRAGGTERFRIGSGGQIGINGANYGTSGQVLTSQGSGSAPQWASPGGIIQVVTANKTDFTDQSTSGNTWYDISGLSVSITPRSSSNKVYVMVSVQFATSGNGGIRLLRNGSAIAIGDSYSSRTRMSAASNSESSIESVSTTISYVDSPGTTSAVTYKVQGLAHTNGGGSGNSFKVNSGWGNGTNADYPQCHSSITLFELSN